MLFITVVLDGVGIGPQPDSALYGDADSHTLGHVCALARPRLPHLAGLGLGCITPLEGIPEAVAPAAAYGKMQEYSAGKDSTTGHWELAGIRLDASFPTYAEGFPAGLIETFLEKTGCTGVLGNKPASGTEIIAELGEAHQDLRFPIVYTSADSVFQIAAHEATIPLDELYRICRITRESVCTGPHAVGRVIARPFIGNPGAYERISAHRKDYSLVPPPGALPEVLRAAGIRTISIGKIYDLFAGAGFDESYKTTSNEEGMRRTIEQARRWAGRPEPTFIWTNLVDFDQEYGHRNDLHGFAAALEAFDRELPELLTALSPIDRLVITADHGNDPFTPSTDHSREYVPLLYYGARAGENLGIRRSFNDLAATAAAFFGAPLSGEGESFA